MSDPIESAFEAASRMLLGRPFSPMEKFAPWLRQRVVHISDVPSAIGHDTAHLPDYSFFGYIPKSRIVAYSQMALAAEKKIDAVDENATLASLLPQICKIAYFVPSFAEGNNLQVERSVAYLDCLNVRDAFDPFRTKNSAYIYQTLDSEALFGSYFILSSHSIIHGYTLINCNRCLEVDMAKNCNDCLFCHHVENLSDCMFCFNAKGLRYAIGNVEVGRENYMRIKTMVQKELMGALEKNGRLPFDIYDVLAKK